MTKNARTISERYEKAQIALRENIDVLTRKAEVYIDWASDTYRDPADKHNVDDDPLSRQVLRDYAFDCSDKYNFPAFGNVHTEDDDTPVKEVADDEYCAIAEKRGVDDRTRPKDAFIRICAGPNDKDAKRIYWYSAKHHVLTMHYCFETAHNRLAAARQWASRSDRDAAKEREIVAREKEDQRPAGRSGRACQRVQQPGAASNGANPGEISPRRFFVQRAARPQHTEPELLPDPHGVAHALSPISAAAPL